MEFQGRKRVALQLDMAPLIDVVFLLLIFYMLTSTLIIPEAIELSLPSSSQAIASQDRPVVVSIDGAGSIAINDEALGLDNVQERISELLSFQSDSQITLKTDASLPVQRMISVMDEVRAAGGTNIELRTRSEPLSGN